MFALREEGRTAECTEGNGFRTQKDDITQQIGPADRQSRNCAGLWNHGNGDRQSSDLFMERAVGSGSLDAWQASGEDS